MTTKSDAYRAELRRLPDWEPYLRQESRLPGPRSNLELAQAVAEEGDAACFERLLCYDAVRAPTNTPDEFLAVCGVLGLGRLLAEGQRELLPRLRDLARDPRWRTREAVAMALQRLGDVDMAALIDAMESWATDTPLVQRAAAAALCEPRLLRDPALAARVLVVLDTITASIPQQRDRRSEAFQALRKGLGYCWSVAVAALPAVGKPAMERWMTSDDPDIRWIMRQNLTKARLARVDAAWVQCWR
ncbi:MAG: HEAT repeat domain-containing protein [Chloroflexales bacterium]